MRWLALPPLGGLGFLGGFVLLGLWTPALSGEAADYVTVGYHDLDKGSLDAIERAAASFARAAALAPNRAEVHAALAHAELARADALVWSVARAGEGDAPSPSTEALSKRANEAAERGFQSAQAALQANPRAAEAQLAMADYYRLKGNLPRARQWRDAAAASGCADDALVYFDASLASSEGSTATTTLTALDALLTRKPEHQRARFSSAAMHWASGDHAKAHALAQQILTAVPEHERAGWYVDAAPSSGDDKSAAGDGEVAPSGDVKDLLDRATKLRNRDRTKQALELYEQALALEPDNARAVVGKAWCLIDSDRAAAAVELLQPLVESKPRLGPALFALGNALEAEGRDDQALKYYKRYMKVSPDGADAEMVQSTIERLSK